MCFAPGAPQGLANKWVRSMEKESGLLVIKLTDANFLRTLENAIQVWYPLAERFIGACREVQLLRCNAPGFVVIRTCSCT